MNDERELYNIIDKLGGHASTKAIAEEYCRQHHMVMQPLYLSVVKSTLSDNEQKVSFNEELGEWEVIPDKFGPNKTRVIGERISADEFTVPTVIIKINRRFRKEMSPEELYEATRGIWKRKLESVKCCEQCLAVYKGSVVEVYKIDDWYPAGSTEYKTRILDKDRCVGRVEFIGTLADETIRSRFIGRSVAALYKPGEADPVKVFNNDAPKSSLALFKSRFEKESGIPSTPVYEIYYAAAKKLWDLYSEQYDLRPRSIANAKKGNNRGVEFYRDGKHIIGISIGKTTTIYVHDKDLRNRLDIDYEISSRGEYRHTYDTVDEVIAAMDGIEDVKGIIFDTNRTYDENSIWEMIQGRKVSAYGTMAEAVNDFRKGDYVFYYHKGYGIVAAGIIKSDTKEIKGDTEELYRDVELLTPEIDSIGENRYISYAELSELLNKSFYMARTAKVPYLSEEECKKVLECLEKKFAAETIGRAGVKK